MNSYLLKTLGKTILLIIGITFIVFFLTEQIDGGFTLTPNILFPIDRAVYSANYGLQDNIGARYLDWLSDFLQGDLGRSITTGRQAVTSIIADSLPRTAILVTSSLLLSMILSITLGILLVLKAKHPIVKVLDHLIIGGMSFPSFLISILLIFLFALVLGWLPIRGVYIPVQPLPWYQRLWVEIQHYIMPVLALTVGCTSTLTSFVKSSLKEIIAADYINTARAKGLKEMAVFYKHALKNAAIPWVTRLGLAVPILFSELIIIEQVFSISGIGRTLLRAITNGDYPVVLGFSVLLTLTVVIINFMVNLIYMWVDPRINYS